MREDEERGSKEETRGRAETTGTFVPTHIFMNCHEQSGTSLYLGNFKATQVSLQPIL